MSTCPAPQCHKPAEILDYCVFESTDGPIEHHKTRCVDGHVFFGSVEALYD